MTKIYFDVTDVVEHAKKNNTVIGISRVQLNIVSLLARKHSGDIVRCTFLDKSQNAMFEFDPSLRSGEGEFDGEQLLAELGLITMSRIFPSKVRIKSYLKQFNNKLVRTLRKIDVYWSAIIMPRRLERLGLAGGSRSNITRIPRVLIYALPPASVYVCLGAVWWFPKIWDFAAAHKARGGKVAQIVYDLIPLVYPEYYTAREPPAFASWLNRSLEYTDEYICISEWTAKDLQKYAEDRSVRPSIKVAPLAHEFVGFDRRAKVAPAVGGMEGRRYVLCVGTIEHRKNNLLLLQIWRQLIGELGDSTPVLVFAGKYGKGGAKVQEALANDAALARHVRVIHGPTDRDLAWLYQNSHFTVFPSQFEGWGLPVGESAWFGKFCVASKATSIPEVCGDLMDYVDPHNGEEIGLAIRRAITDNVYLAAKEKRIVGSELRTWADTADQIFAYASDST